MSKPLELTRDVLLAEPAELLPPRETLFFDINVSPVVGVNLAVAVNAATIGSTANAGAWQDVVSISY